MIVRGGLIGGTASNRNSLGREESKMAATGTATSTEKGRRIVGAERQSLAKDLVKRYTSGESIRALAASTGRSYGFVHRVLTESGVQLRQRGGARRRKKA
jgi:predicted transcriptional regulator